MASTRLVTHWGPKNLSRNGGPEPYLVHGRLRQILSSGNAPSSLAFLSFFLGFRRPNQMTGLSGWQTDRWRTIVTKTSNGIRERSIPPASHKHRDMVVKTRRRQRAGVSLRGDLCYDNWSLSHLGHLYPGTTPVMIKLDHDRSCPWV